MKVILKCFLLCIIFCFIISHSFALKKYNAMPINWYTCQDDARFNCGMLTVPVDYSDPDTFYIQLPVTIHYATKNKLGTIITNYGGPWGDGNIETHEKFSSFTESIQNNYDVVSFVPRGVAPNTIACNSANIESVDEIQRELELMDINSIQAIQMVYDGVVQKQSLCSYSSLVKNAGTKNTVQDIELLRQSLGVNKIDYIGISYGTRLGLAYLITYPEHVGKMLLDSNMAPNNRFDDLVSTTTSSSDNVLKSFFYFCSISNINQCAIYESNSTAIELKYTNLLLNSERAGGIPTSTQFAQRKFSAAMLRYISNIIVSDPSYWPIFASALQQAIQYNNADLLMSFYISLTGYIPESNSYQNYSNSAVLNAVMCKDYIVPNSYQSKASWVESINNLLKQFPSMGGISAATVGGWCIGWQESSDPLLPAALTPIFGETPKVLLVNNLYDPRTPLSSTYAVSDYLEKANIINNRILVWAGAGHGSFTYSAPANGCIDQNVNRFFATESGQLPLTSVCYDGVNPFLNPQTNKKNLFVKRNMLGF